jgi:uncharacterized protein YpmS
MQMTNLKILLRVSTRSCGAMTMPGKNLEQIMVERNSSNDSVTVAESSSDDRIDLVRIQIDRKTALKVDYNFFCRNQDSSKLLSIYQDIYFARIIHIAGSFFKIVNL